MSSGLGTGIGGSDSELQQRSRESVRRWDEVQRAVPAAENVGGQPAVIRAYKATADESSGEITVKRVNADGTVVGDNITLKVLP